MHLPFLQDTNTIDGRLHVIVRQQIKGNHSRALDLPVPSSKQVTGGARDPRDDLRRRATSGVLAVDTTRLVEEVRHP